MSATYPPPPPPPRRVSIRVHAFEPHLKIFGYMPLHTRHLHHLYWSMIVGRQIWGAWGEPPPPPRAPTGFRFVYMYAFEPHFKMAMPMHMYTPPILVYDCQSTYTGYVGKPPPPPLRVLIPVHAFEPHFKIPGYVNGYTSVMPPILVYDCWLTNTGCVGWSPPPPPR